MCNAGHHPAERGQFLTLHQLILRRFQILHGVNQILVDPGTLRDLCLQIYVQLLQLVFSLFAISDVSRNARVGNTALGRDFCHREFDRKRVSPPPHSFRFDRVVE